MKINGKHYRSVWSIGEGAFGIIDQTKLPHEFVTLTLKTWQDAAHAISSMQTRGAPLIGAVGAYGLALAMREDASDENLAKVHDALAETRPTAINLRWALGRMRDALLNRAHAERAKLAWAEAAAIADEDVAMSKAIGEHGLAVIKEIAAKKPGRTVNILTHCNAGWLATVDYGTALAPIYLAHDAGIPLHVWVDETRPRGQGASLTAFELGGHGVQHTILADNAGGHYMQHGAVDLVRAPVGAGKQNCQRSRRGAKAILAGGHPHRGGAARDGRFTHMLRLFGNHKQIAIDELRHHVSQSALHTSQPLWHS